MTTKDGLEFGAARLRAARENDGPALAELAEQLGYPQSGIKPQEQLARIHAKPDHAVFVATDGADRPVGWIHVYRRTLLQVAPHAEVGGLVVAESQRGRGIGQALLEKAEQWARDRGMGRIMMHTNTVRKRADGFYEQNGYSVLKQSLRLSKDL
jgi:PhnO protein